MDEEWEENEERSEKEHSEEKREEIYRNERIPSARAWILRFQRMVEGSNPPWARFNPNPLDSRLSNKSSKTFELKKSPSSFIDVCYILLEMELFDGEIERVEDN